MNHLCRPGGVHQPHSPFVTVCLAFLCFCFFAGCDDTDNAANPGQNEPGEIRSGGSPGAHLGAAQETGLQFVDVAADSGLNFTYRNGEENTQFAILESLGGGVGLLDYDNDGRLDVVLPGGGGFKGETVHGMPSALFQNLGQLRFQPVTEMAGVADSRIYSHGIAVTDLDGDGFSDFVVTGYGRLRLFTNQGDGTFLEEAATAGLNDNRWSSSAAFGDFNSDGHPDLYVARYVNWSFENNPKCPGPKPGDSEICPPRQFEGLPDSLYLSNGDGTFVDATTEWGLSDEGKGLGLVVGDVDLDGDLDVYIGNDTVPNFLFLNAGDRFENASLVSGTAYSEDGQSDGSMGVDLGDFDGDGKPDIWVANFERESFALYRNDGGGYFQPVSSSIGVTATGALYVGWGTTFFDPDLDGDSDLFVSNGHVIRFPVSAPLRQKSLVLLNQAGKRVVNVAESAGEYTSSPHMGRGLACGDLDNDGDADLVISHTNEPVALLDNRSKKSGSWIRLRLIGRTSSRIPVGAIVRVEVDGKTEFVHQIRSGGSYASSSD
ncbi:MAG: VCBS repeat-containing protein, partial [Planctomycetota bacterium]|nr:VCBS repeat-containing protein [Planctomycetota bacterium]